MRRTDRVATHLPHNTELAFQRTPVESCAQCTQVVMVTNTFDLYPATIQEKAFARNANFTYAKRCIVTVCFFSINLYGHTSHITIG